MTERPSSRNGRPSSQIPVPVNRRASYSILQSSTNSVNTNSNPSSSRAASPLTIGKPPPVKNGTSPHVNVRRQSLLTASGSRKASFSETGGDDPTHLKAQIALLQSSLYASHQRILDLTSGLDLNTSMSTSPGGASTGIPGSPRPWTPSFGWGARPEGEGLTPGSDLVNASALLEEDEDPDRSTSSDPLPNGGGGPVPELEPAQLRSLPHSLSSYDLRSRAVTPGRNGVPLPDKGISRIPQATVTHALSLHPTPPANSPSSVPRPTSRSTQSASPSPLDTSHLRSPFVAPDSPHSPSYPNGNGEDGLSPALRRSAGLVGSAASTRVIDSLQTELVNTRGHLERVKQEVRSCQRVIGSLTRQTEDQKETRERMRVECEGLNNVIARKERLLQEVLERARTAESSLSNHLSTKKALEQTTKKSLQHMQTQLAEAQASQARAEREAGSLRDSVKSLRDVWGREVKSVREEWRRSEEKGRKEREEARATHMTLVKLVQSQTAERATIQDLAQTATEQGHAAQRAFTTQVADLRSQVDKGARDAEDAKSLATELAGELVRLRRLMREPQREELSAAAAVEKDDPT